MKHPKSELYSAIIPTFESKNAKGFATELADLALSVEGNEDLNIVIQNYEILLKVISQNEKIVDSKSNTFESKMALVKSLLEVAAEETEISLDQLVETEVQATESNPEDSDTTNN